MSERKKKFHWVPHIIRHDFWRKFFALIFAMLVTATVYSDKRKHEDEIFVIHNVQPTLSLERGFVWNARNLQQVSLTVRGPRAKLFDLKPEDFTLDYMIGEQEFQSRNKNGMQYVTLKANDVRCRHPKGALLQVLEITPSEYTFAIDKIVTRTLDLEPVFDTEGARYKVEEDKVEFLDRKTVDVTGPLRTLEKYKTIQTMPISLKNQVTDFTINVDLKQNDNLSYDANSAILSVKLKRFLKKDIDNVKVAFILPPEKSKNFSVEKIVLPPQVKVTVYGDVDSVNNLYAEDLLVYVDFSDLSGAGTYTDVPIRCSVKNQRLTGISAVSVTPLVIPEITLKEKDDTPPGIVVVLQTPAEKEAELRKKLEARRQAVAEAKRKEAEEIKRKAEAEAKRKAEEEARRAAELKKSEDARKAAEEKVKAAEAKAKTAEEAKRKAEEAMRKEQDARKNAEAKTKTAEEKVKAAEAKAKTAEEEARKAEEAQKAAEAKAKTAEEARRKAEEAQKAAEQKMSGGQKK